MLTKISKSQFSRNLKSRKLEDLGLIKTVEKALLAKRGYVFRRPRPGTPVILLLSGGLDSITCWGILMKEFGLRVYPLSFDRGEKRAPREEKSIAYFSSYYQKRFPGLYQEPIRLRLGTEKINVPIEQALERLHPKFVTERFHGESWLMEINISFGAFLLVPVYAKLYAEYLYYTQLRKIRTIFCAVTLGDGVIVPHQTFTALRAIMFYLCLGSGDFSWQFASTVFEKETGLYFDKADLVRWAVQHKLPLEKTWSCYHAASHQCGGSDCVTCRVRRRAFEKAGVADKTIYRPLEEQVFWFPLKRLYQQALARFSSWSNRA